MSPVFLLVRSSLAAVLALALAVGPVANAACLHDMHEEMATEHGGEMPMPEHDDVPPCHSEPEPEPAPADDCASACCASEATVMPPAPLPVAEAASDIVLPTFEVRVLPADPTPEEPTASPPRPPGPLRVALERFLI